MLLYNSIEVNMTQVEFKSKLDNTIYSGVVISTTTNKFNKQVNIVVVHNANNKNIFPFLKWIEDCQCTSKTIKTSKLDSKYLNSKNWNIVTCEFIGK